MNLSRALTLLFVLFLSCCNSGGLEQKIADNIKKRCQYSDNCLIRIAELTNFPWDRMYVFSYRVTLDEMTKSLGVDYPQYTEFTRKIVFLKEGRIVYREEHSANLEKLVNGEVVFDIPGNSVHKDYTPDTAVFNVTKMNIEGGVWFRLRQTNHAPSN